MKPKKTFRPRVLVHPRISLGLTAGLLLAISLAAPAQVAPPLPAASLEDSKAQAVKWSQQGDKAAAANDFASALDSYRKAVELDPARFDHVVRLAGAYAAIGLMQSKEFQATLKDPAAIATLKAAKMPSADQLPSAGVALQELIEAKRQVFTAPAAQTQLKTALGAAAALLSSEGNVALDRSNYSAAVDYYSRALSSARQAEDREQEVAALNGLGNSYDNLGQHERAIRTFTDQLEILKQIKAPAFPLAMTLNNIGWAYDGAGQSEKALGFYQQALALDNSVEMQAYTVGNMGLSYYRLKQPEKGIANGERALALMRQTRNRVGEGSVLSWLGWGYSHNGQTDKALATLAQALTLNHNEGNKASEAFTLSTLMFTWKTLNQPRLAVFYGKQAVNVYQEIRQNSRRLDKDLQKSLLQSHEDTYRTLADLLIGAGRLPEAQQVLGLLKEEELFDFVRRDAKTASSLEGRAVLSPEEAAEEKRYQEISDRLTKIGVRRGDLLAKETRTPEEEKELATLEEDLSAANSNFQKYLTSLSTQLGGTLQNDRVQQIKDAQSLQETLRELGSGTVALYTLVSDDKYRVILITPDAQKAGEYAIPAADLNRKVLKFRQALQNPRLDPKPLAQELYKILVAPMARDLEGAGAKTLMWSLDGTLRYLPMSALHDGKEYLVTRYRSTVFTPASNVNLKDEPTARWKALGLGVSKAQPGFEALPGVAAELNSIITTAVDSTAPVSRGDAPATDTGVLPGTVSLDEAFTADSMKTALRQRYPLIHIASHFAFNPGNETNSFLLLGDGSHYTIDQIKNLSFRNVDLLTLSACDTATGGTDAKGNEVESFAVLAQRQGARAVMATLWPVADESTQHLMREFYRLREVQTGTTKAEALRQAQLALLQGTATTLDPNAAKRGARLLQSSAGTQNTELPPFVIDTKAPFAHPYYWAPFILIGNWR